MSSGSTPVFLLIAPMIPLIAAGSISVDSHRTNADWMVRAHCWVYRTLKSVVMSLLSGGNVFGCGPDWGVVDHLACLQSLPCGLQDPCPRVSVRRAD